ncbi:hypothetical protein O9992_16925 [Vibrio lentus]|nr:hypothetical protein [Vibrio lentus]
MISVFDIYKIGVGPSSSHTVGPMKAGKKFVLMTYVQWENCDITKITVDVYGSLSLTGKVTTQISLSSWVLQVILLRK